MGTINTVITRSSITVNFDGRTHTMLSTDPSFDAMKQALRDGDEASVRSLVDVASAIQTAANATSDGGFKVQNGIVSIDGTPVRGELQERILSFYTEKLPFQPLVNFARKVRKNPSYRAVSDLFTFLEKNKHPLTPNGNFIAYKRVHAMNSEGKMLDIHSRTFDNSPGKTCEMPRNEVDEDPTRPCRAGLHVANWDYAANCFGNPQTDVMIEVEVDPADVVAIPLDYNQAKMRTCKYTVRGLVANPNGNKTLVPDESTDLSSDGDTETEEEESGYSENIVDECEECGMELDEDCVFDLCSDCLDNQEESEDLSSSDETEQETEAAEDASASTNDVVVDNTDDGSSSTSMPTTMKIDGVSIFETATLRRKSSAQLHSHLQRLIDSRSKSPLVKEQKEIVRKILKTR